MVKIILYAHFSYIMKQIRIALVLVLLTLGFGTSTYAQVGLGYRFGSPTGFNGKFYYGKDKAIDATLTIGITTQSFHPTSLSAVHQWHIFTGNPDFVIYYGLGAYVHVRGYGFGISEHVAKELDYGVIGAVGVEYLIPTTYLQVFGDLMPGGSLAPGKGGLFLGPTIGARYLF